MRPRKGPLLPPPAVAGHGHQIRLDRFGGFEFLKEVRAQRPSGKGKSLGAPALHQRIRSLFLAGFVFIRWVNVLGDSLIGQ